MQFMIAGITSEHGLQPEKLKMAAPSCAETILSPSLAGSVGVAYYETWSNSAFRRI